MHALIHQLSGRFKLGSEANGRLWQLSGLHQPPPGLGTALWRGLGLLAALLLGAGLIFWVAANWQVQTRSFKLNLLQAAVLLPVLGALAWRRGRTALLWLATLALGGLLAFVGQTYQTGADAWQLFAAWAALALPWALVARSDGLWAGWLAVAGAALVLWAGDAFFDPLSWLFGSRSAASLLMPLLWLPLWVWPLLLPRWRLLDARARWSWRVATLLTLGAWCFYAVQGLLQSEVSALYTLGLALVAGATWLAWAWRPRDYVVLGLALLALNVLVIGGCARLLFANSQGSAVGAALLLTLVAAACVGISGTWLYRLQHDDEEAA